jgi:hypothetical protein
MMPPEPPPIGHNSRHSLQATAEQNVESGVLLLCKEFLVTAIQDKRLDRTHLRVLACFVEFINRRTAKAWPGRQLIADTLQIHVKTVSNALLDLRNWGYLIAERERVEEAGNRSLMVYSFGNIDHDTIRREIDAYIANLKGSKVPPQGEHKSRPEGTSTQSPAPAGLSKSCQEGTVTPQRDFQDLSQNRKSRPSGDSNLDTKTTTVVSASPSAQPNREKAARLPDDWKLPKTWGQWALDNFEVSANDVRGVASVFKDHWIAKTGKDAVKRDWEATWRNWCRSTYTGWKPKKVDTSHAPDLLGGDQPKGAGYAEAMRKLNAMVERPR